MMQQNIYVDLYCFRILREPPLQCPIAFDQSTMSDQQQYLLKPALHCNEIRAWLSIHRAHLASVLQLLLLEVTKNSWLLHRS